MSHENAWYSRSDWFKKMKSAMRPKSPLTSSRFHRITSARMSCKSLEGIISSTQTLNWIKPNIRH